MNKLLEEVLDEAKIYNAGFDHTAIKGSNWKNIIEMFDLKYQGIQLKMKGGSTFHKWSKGKNEIRTLYNPIDGESSREGGHNKDQGKDEPKKDFAGYIGITGSKDFVEEAFDNIDILSISSKEKNKKMAEWI